MKRTLSILLLVIMVMAVCTHVAAAKPIGLKPIGDMIILDPGLIRVKRTPDTISEMEEVSIWDMDRESEQKIPYSFSFSCVDVHDYHTTVVYGAGHCYVAVGRYFFNEEEGLLWPFDEDSWYNSVCLEPTEDGLKVHGYVTGSAAGVIPAEPVTDGNSYAEVYDERLYFGWDEEEFVDVSVIVPDAFSIRPDTWAAIKSPFGYLPGQDGTDFYLNSKKVSVKYFQYGSDRYTEIQSVDGGTLFIKGWFLYDATHYAMCCTETNISIGMEWRTGHFIVHCGGVSWASSDYIQKGDDLFFLGGNVINVVVDDTQREIKLSDIEGYPLVIW